MRVAFWGSPLFAVPSLERLLASNHEVVGVVTQPARPRGRGRRVVPTAVGRVADAAGVPVLAPRQPHGDEFLTALADWAPEVSLVAAYGAILRPDVLALPPRGSYNVHASILPAYRGAAPVTRALLDGASETGVTIMRMEAGLDSGPACLVARTPIAPDDTAGSVTDRLASLGADLAVEALSALEAGELRCEPQDDAQATYAPKVTVDEARIDWSRPTAELARAVRAYDPWPGAWTRWRGERLKLYDLEASPTGEQSVAPGTIVGTRGALVVETGDGAAVVGSLQPAGGRRMDGAEWGRGRRVAVGDRLGEDADA